MRGRAVTKQLAQTCWWGPAPVSERAAERGEMDVRDHKPTAVKRRYSDFSFKWLKALNSEKSVLYIVLVILSN